MTNRKGNDLTARPGDVDALALVDAHWQRVEFDVAPEGHIQFLISLSPYPA